MGNLIGMTVNGKKIKKNKQWHSGTCSSSQSFMSIKPSNFKTFFYALKQDFQVNSLSRFIFMNDGNQTVDGSH